ncbi:XdhC family protein [Halalkalicoccus sp. NIPERK01]|uniref:XdhC family protein n=1 Tax=Halalkalicoccus sp. NIPERK01 TaxID=3053469 RepID=UPI00256F5825|nr:XdhC/CoxI family protein [Halalkalicoccus sp. NIPERK01]MDL5363246.1 XdhC family protein [Halalkalicoccus sp. NIPERK01]
MHGATGSWSATTPELFERIRHAIEDDSSLAVATVVDVEGAAYRRPGAKMVIEPDGTSYGGITAGCLQDPLRTVASEVLESGRPTVVTYDLTNNDGWGLGLGCNGVIDVLIEPVDDSWQQAVDAYANRRACSLITVVESNDPSIPVGARTSIGEFQSAYTDHVHSRVSLPDSVVSDIEDHARACAVDGRIDRIHVSTESGEIMLVIDGVEPPQQLVIFGSQPDAQAVARLATQVGLRATVASARGGRANKEAFPAAERVLAIHPTDLSEAGLDERTAVVIMSHNFIDDRLALEAALETKVPYIGLMGPRKRFEELESALQDDGTTLSDHDRNRIAAPVGLDLGGGEPMEIALSIVSEVVAVGHGHTGGCLTDRIDPIHDRQLASPD